MAQILGISANAVMLRCQRAKTTLKSIMEQRS
jgi:DNA-directed RNA polymerase specialized sigma24 family protein